VAFKEIDDCGRRFLRLLYERNVPAGANLTILRALDIVRDDLREERWDEIVVVSGDD